MKKFIRIITDLFNYFIFIIFVIIIGLLPFRFLYLFSNILAIVLRKVFRYRYAVITENLEKSNIEIDKYGRKKLIKQIYLNLSDVLVEGIKSLTMQKKTVIKRHKVLNPEIVIPYYDKKKSVILVTGHIGNWEWGSLSAGLYTPYHILAFYKKLRNPYIDRFLRWSRSRFGTTLATIKETTLSFDKQKNTSTMFLMAADQHPTKTSLAYTAQFLGRETAFLHGPEKHARNNNYPLLFADIRRKKRGYYEIKLSVLIEKPDTFNVGEITRLYAAKLESAIKENPSDWLWSHKRWKQKKIK
ncbi:MAG: hypothetical protein EA393_02605 [Bacteroidetes bacterium]|nr:MAG: hypothetical protein EA393_02605 [Bacteroidota bacterium]